MKEVLRVLAPNGVAYIKKGSRWTKTVKPWPKEIDEWTHYFHGADGNPVARDSIVGPPEPLQFNFRLDGDWLLVMRSTGSSYGNEISISGTAISIRSRAARLICCAVSWPWVTVSMSLSVSTRRLLHSTLQAVRRC